MTTTLSILLRNNRSVIAEFLFVNIIMAATIAMITHTDIVAHDYYAKPLGAECNSHNTSKFCEEVRALHGCTIEQGYNCLLARYWQLLTFQMLFLGGLLAFIRIAVAAFTGRDWKAPVRLYATFVWASAPVILLFTGWEDYLYYATRGMPVPDTLPWLDQNGLMPHINKALNVSTTTPLSLYLLMTIGGVTIMTLFAIKLVTMRAAGLKTPI